MATCESLGMTSRRSSSRLPSRSGAIELSPVMFPPGRARLGTIPVPTGSPTATMTRGTVDVAFLTASAAGVPAVTITSTFAASNSAMSAGKRSYFPSAHRYSMTNVPALGVAMRAQAVAKRLDEVGFERGRGIAQKSDARHFSGLRARRDRPGSGGATEQRKEFTAFQLIVQCKSGLPRARITPCAPAQA